MLSHVRTRSGAFAAALLALLVTAAAAWAQDAGNGDDMTEAERQRAAKAEQEQRRKEAEQAEQQATASAEDKAEQERLEKMGAAGTEPLIDEEKGFFLRLDAFAAEPDGADTSVARVGQISTSATTAEELDADGDGLPDAFSIVNERDLRLQYDSELTPQVELGWRFGHGGALSLRWWSLSASSSVSADESLQLDSSTGGAPLRLGGIDSPGAENDAGAYGRDPDALARPLGSIRLVTESRLHGADSVVADGKLDMSRFDLLYGRTALARKHFVLSYRVGLSMVELTRTESATFVFTSFERTQVGLNAIAVESVDTSSKSSGIGPTAGIQGRWLFGDSGKWGVRFGVDVAGVRAEPDLAFRDAQLFDLDVVEPREEVYQDVTTTTGEDFISILEGDLAVEALVGGRFRIALGYRMGTWKDAVTDLRFPDPNNGALMVRDVHDVDLGGPYVRVGIFF